MAAPEYVPVPPTAKSPSYQSPDHVPDAWMRDRPADFDGRQPQGRMLGNQGPDQGYAITLANRFRDRLHLQPGESADDAIAGCLGIALRRASMFGRAPVVHDLTIAFTMWGFLDASPPPDLLEARRHRFAEVGFIHHYAERRELADAVPEAVLRGSPADVAARYPREWSTLTGA
jgi:hypothetical protein